MMPHECDVPQHGPYAHKHPRSIRWFYKPAPDGKPKPRLPDPRWQPGVTILHD